MSEDRAEAGQIERQDGPSKGRYVLVVDGVEAEMTYSLSLIHI